jgi:single-stranded DNA-binding protein
MTQVANKQPALNIATLTALVTEEPQLRYLPNGTPATKLLLSGKTLTGQQFFIEAERMGNKAEDMLEQFPVGTSVTIKGKLAYESWTDQQTQEKRSKVKLVVLQAFPATNEVTPGHNSKGGLMGTDGAFNQVLVEGRTTATPRTNHDPEGNQYTNMTIAIDDGEWNGKAKTIYIDVRLTGELAAQFANTPKGTLVQVGGAISKRSWTDQNGEKRYGESINASSFVALMYSKAALEAAEQPEFDDEPVEEQVEPTPPAKPANKRKK